MSRGEISQWVSNQKLSWILQIASCVFWTFSFIFPNEHRMHFLETNLSRAVVGVAANYLLMWYYNGSLDLMKGSNLFYASCRSFTNVVQGMLCTLLMYYLPMPIIHTITSTSTVYTANIEHYCYALPMSSRTKWLALLSVLGVMLQANGHYLSHLLWPRDGSQERISQFKNYEHISAIQSVIISFVFTCYVGIFSFGLVCIKRVKLAHYELNFYNNTVHILMTGFLYFLIPESAKSPISTLLLSIPFSGLPVFFAQLSFVVSLQLCKSVGLMMILNTANILFAYLISVLRYKE